MWIKKVHTRIAQSFPVAKKNVRQQVGRALRNVLKSFLQSRLAIRCLYVSLVEASQFKRSTYDDTVEPTRWNVSLNGISQGQWVEDEGTSNQKSASIRGKRTCDFTWLAPARALESDISREIRARDLLSTASIRFIPRPIFPFLWRFNVPQTFVSVKLNSKNRD